MEANGRAGDRESDLAREVTGRTRAAALVAGGAVLAVGALAAVLASSGSDAAPVSARVLAAAALTPPSCSASTARGVVNDACTAELLKWQQEFRNGLGTNTYYPKWRKANPGEYGRLKTWGTSDPSTPQPAVATGYGAVVRYGLGQCRTWAVDLSSCLLP